MEHVTTKQQTSKFFTMILGTSADVHQVLKEGIVKVSLYYYLVKSYRGSYL